MNVHRLETSHSESAVEKTSGEKLDRASELPDDSGEWGKKAELPDDSGEWGEKAKLPDDSGEWGEKAKLPDDSGEWGEKAKLPDDSGEWGEETEAPKDTDGANSKADRFSVHEGSEKNDVNESQPIQNKVDGLRREAEVKNDLESEYPQSEGYKTISEAYLRDSDGKIVKDDVTGEARRIDFVVVNGDRVVASIEVTSLTADKSEQCAKEKRIREKGGNYIKDPDTGNLIKIPDDVTTQIERRE